MSSTQRASVSHVTQAVVSLDRPKHAEKRESTVERRSAAAVELEASKLKAQLQVQIKLVYLVSAHSCSDRLDSWQNATEHHHVFSECKAYMSVSQQEANATNHQIKQSMYLMNRVLRL